MMPEEQALDQLCRLYGIAPEYTDDRGDRHQVSAQTKRALLAAMGLHLDQSTDLQQVLEDCEARAWQRILPPVMVIRHSGTPTRIPLILTADRVKAKLNWTLILENGEHHRGELRPRDLETTAVYRDGQAKCYGFPLPLPLDIGYHRLELTQTGHPSAAMGLIVVPTRCYQPAAIARGERLWGLSLPLYGLRSQRNWGIGDLTDLKVILENTADLGAALVGISPPNALFPSQPEQVNPYWPSSRLLFSILYLDVEAVADFAECSAAQEAFGDSRFQAQLRALRASDQVDYKAVRKVKLTILEHLYRHFRDHHLHTNSLRGKTFRAFQKERGESLAKQALFDALDEHFCQDNPSSGGWLAWPTSYRDPTSEAVAAFAREHPERVEFYVYLQWQLAQQFEAVGVRSLELHLGIGLYQDLPLSPQLGGAEVWANQALYALTARLGVPPDGCYPEGQHCPLAPLNPVSVVEAVYELFTAVLRRNMAQAGALGINFVALQRQFWVPVGAKPAEGTYISYPFEDLLGIIALESQRNQCLVIATQPTPNSDRDTLAAYGVLCRQLLYSSKKSDGDFQVPEEYSRHSLVAISTFSLPTLMGYWQGTDLSLRDKLGCFPSPERRDDAIVERSQERARLRIALQRQALLPADTDVHAFPIPELTPEMICAVYLYLARSPAQILIVRVEDLFAQVEQTYFPGIAADQYPNWRYKLSLNLEDWLGNPQVRALAAALGKERGAGESKALILEEEPIQVKTRIPDATYRLQFNSGFTFAQATEIVPYLHGLGISHCYASPYLSARSGSSHGYDIIDHTTLNPEIGSRADFERFRERLRRYAMGQILDMVPNHMGVMGCDNAWWLDVLENGPAAKHAVFFDIDWQPYQEERRNKVLLPVLGNHYGIVLESGELQLIFNTACGTFRIHYYEHCFPIDPHEYPRILGHRIEQLGARLGSTELLFLEYQSLITAFGHLPGCRETAPEKVAERQRDKEIHKRQLAELCRRSPDIALFIEENVQIFNGTPGTPQSYSALHALLEAQPYRLSFWRVASDSINYRRFFDINDLAALCTENEAVFRTIHSLVLELLAQGKLDGLRIDHPDGLYDPKQYFQRLQEATVTRGSINDATGAIAKPLYVVVEKILESYERLPEDWPVHGTTGYEFANLVNALLVDANTEETLTRIYAEFIGEHIDFEEMLYQCKKLIMEVSLASELSVLATQLSRIAQADRRTRDFTPLGLWRTLTEIVACFPVYRTYITPGEVSEDDRRYVDWAVAKAKKRSQAADITIFDFVRDVLLTLAAEGKPAEYRDAVIGFAMKFQQYTGPLMAKGLEDTAFYRYNRLVSLNEVGGDPRRFALSINGFHHINQERVQRWPHAMLNTSTHDSKRSEDVRARINVLSELPQEWQRHLKRWSRINKSKKRLLDGAAVPSANDEYLLYQTLLGTWPLEQLSEAKREEFRLRIERYMLKAVREAKVHSSWINPDPAYEEAVINFIRALLASKKNRFLEDFLPFQRIIAHFGFFNSLSQTLLKLTVPGVPDIYQANEIWDFSLVDPDNRRPVDYGLRQRLLNDLQHVFRARDAEIAPRARSLLDSLEDGRVKLYVIWKTLILRRQQPDLFRDGDYTPLTVTGSKADHICAFARRFQAREALIIVPRLFARLLGGETKVQPLGEVVWQDTRLELTNGEARRYVNAFTREILTPETSGETLILPLARVLNYFPLALLVRN